MSLELITRHERFEPWMTEVAKRFGFVPEEELDSGWCSVVFASGERVLKLPWRGEEQTSGGFAAVILSDSIGPKVLEHDPVTGSLLMERVVPGNKISDRPEELTREVFCELASRMPLDAKGPWIDLEDYSSDSDILVRQLLRTTTSKVFLHGDLHHENILESGDGWVAIDPKGLWGDRAFEFAAFLRNPIPDIGKHPDLRGLLMRRIEYFAAQFELDPWRIWGWGLVQIREDLDPSSPWVEVVRALEQIEPTQ